MESQIWSRVPHSLSLQLKQPVVELQMVVSRLGLSFLARGAHRFAVLAGSTVSVLLYGPVAYD